MVNTKTPIDILSIGELLIDFTPTVSAGKTIYFEQNPGGAPANLLAMAAKLGMNTAFIGKVGRDAFGAYLADILKQNGIDTDGLIFSDKAPTTLAFVHLNENGERSFSFYRNQSADVLLRSNEINTDLIDRCKIFHFGSLSFTDDPCKSAVLDALQYAKRSDKYISYDPNYRPALWKSEREALEGMRLGLQFADILKLSEEEALMLSGEETIETAANYFIDQNIALVLITLGDQGSFYATKQHSGYVESYGVDQIDATGAGDAFIGAVLSELVRSGCKINELDDASLYAMLRFANACAALCVTRRGGIPSMPILEEVSNLIKYNM